MMKETHHLVPFRPYTEPASYPTRIEKIPIS